MAETNSPATRETDRQNITFIALLRAIASLLVVWCHLVSGWTIHHHVTFFPLTVAQTYLTGPLAIIEDFGFLGVALFFFVSGFIITHVAQRESQFAFLIKRILRIYPPLIFSIIVVGGLYLLGNDPVDEAGNMGVRKFSDFLWASTLANYFWQDNHYINGVAWTLIIEVVFYSLCLLTLPLMKWSATTVTLLLATLCGVVVLRSHDLGDHFGAMAVSCGLIPLLLIGQSTYWIWSRKIRFRQFLLLLAANWFVFACALGSLYVEMLPADNSYGVSALYAYLIFLIAMLANDHLRLPRFLGFYATISYSLYLLHVPIGEYLLSKLYPHIGYNWAIVPVFAIITLISYLSWRFIEQPSQIAAKTILKRLKVNPIAGGLHRGYSISVAALLIVVCVLIIMIHPAERVPLRAFLMPGNLYPAVAAINSTTAINADPLTPVAAPALTTNPATIDGNFDQADSSTLSGWAWDSTQPNVPVTIEIYIDHTLAGTAIANKLRDDLLKLNLGNGLHGFVVQSPEILKDGKTHSVSIKVMGCGVEIPSSPQTITSSK